MARKSMTDLKAEATANLPDNTTGLISPADVRGSVIDFMDTMTPGYCAAQLNTQTVSLGTTPTPITNWQAPIVITPEFTFDAANGVVTLAADCVIDFRAQIEVQVSSSRIVTISSNFSGSGTPGVYKSRQEGEGGSDPMIMSLNGLFDGVIGDTLSLNIELDGGSGVSTGLDGLILVQLIPLINNPTP